jgi:excisionase family DNA binding protein
VGSHGRCAVSDGQRRVPHVRELAVLGDFAVIGGYSAWFLARLLTGYPGGLEPLLARSAVPPDRRDDILRAVTALGHVGVSWRLEHASGSGSGTAFGKKADPPAGSKRGPLLSPHENGETSTAAREASPILGTTEVASALGVSTRLVRRLAGSGALPGQRDAGGRWQFSAADVATERERRVNQQRDGRAVA